MIPVLWICHRSSHLCAFVYTTRSVWNNLIHLSNSHVTFILFLTLLSLLLNQASLKWWEVLRVAAKLFCTFKFPNQCLKINNTFIFSNLHLQLNSTKNQNLPSENFNFFVLVDDPLSLFQSENYTSKEIGDNCEILGSNSRKQMWCSGHFVENLQRNFMTKR